MALSVGFRITISLLILLPKLRGSDSYPGGTDSHRTRQPSLDAQRPLPGHNICDPLARDVLPNARDSTASGAREATSALNGQPTLPLPEFLPTCREKLPRLYR
jgi:hypothetical protein